MKFLSRVILVCFALQLISTITKSQSLKKELPLIFQENKGQWEKEIAFKAVNSNSQIYFTNSKLVFTHSRSKQSGKDLNLEHLNWSLSFEGCQKNVTIHGEGENRSISNYLTGNQSSQSINNVKDYSSIVYNNIYNSIDLKYYTEGTRLKYDYVLKPGSSISDIKIKCDGIKKLWIKNEELFIQHEWGTIKELKPYSYQDINGIKREVKITYQILNDQTYGFKIEGEYNPAYNIVLDPVTLVWGTYVGGNNASNGGYLYDLTTDISGNIYATGYYPNTFPVTANAYGKTFNGGYGDVFVFKLSENGSNLVYATYIGGNDDDRGYGIAVNSIGEAFITGYTASGTSFPTTNTFGTMLTGKNVFVCKLSSDGSSLVYSAYIAGQNHDYGNGIEVDKNGNAYIVGETQSSSFPVTSGAYASTYGGGSSDGFVLKLNPSGDALIYSTFLGGSSDDRARALKINSAGEVYVTGVTKSPNYPTSQNAYDKTLNGDFDVFVTKINAKGDGILYSTFIGGLAAEEGQSIDVNQNGEAFITGYTFSPDYPRTYSPKPLQGLSDLFVTRLDKTGSSLIYSRYIGGSQMEEGTSIVVNELNHAIIAGVTKSVDFPLVLNGIFDKDSLKDKEFQVFALLLGDDGTQIKKSVKLGGSYDDYKIPSLSFPDKRYICNVIIGFTSHSPDLSTTDGSYQKKKLNGDHTNDQPAVFSLNFGPDPLPAMVGKDFTYCPVEENKEYTFCAPADYDPDYPIKYLWSNGSTQRCVTVTNKDMDPSLKIAFSNGCQSNYATFKATKYNLPKISLGKDTTLCKGKSLDLSVNLLSEGIGDYTYKWSNGSTSDKGITIDKPGIYWVEITTQCAKVRDSITITEIDIPLSITGSSRSLCFPGSYEINGLLATNPFPAVSYSWSTGEKTPDIIVTKGGNYILTITNVCGSVSATHTINELHVPVVNLGNDTSICQNVSIVLDPHSDGISYLWSTGATSKTITVSTPGLYWVEVTNTCGKTRDEINVSAASQVPVVNLGPDKKLCQAFSLVLDAASPGNNYYWNTGATTQSITVTTGGTYSVTVTNGCGTTTDAIEIISSPSLSLELGPDQSICAPQTVLLSVPNPGGKVNYVWSTGEKTSSITVSTSGIYTVTVSNECGSASDNVKVTSYNSLPVVSLGKDTSICANTDFKLEAKPNNSTFLWNTSEQTSFIIANIAKKDTFWVDASNACGVTRDSIILDIVPTPIVNLGKDTSICVPASITLNAFNKDATYLWSTGATSSSITVNSTGTYYVDVKRCTTVRGTINIVSNTEAPKINLGKDKTICSDFSLELDAGLNPGAKYDWRPKGERTQAITVTKGNLYIVNAYNGCGNSSDSINIIGKPITELGDDVAACKSDTLVLDAGNKWAEATYEWSTNETSQTIKVHKSGVYTVTVTNVCGVVHDKISIAMDTVKCVVNLGPDLRKCAPVNITLDAENPGSKYLWSTGATSQTIDINSSGKYKVLVTNGCGTTPDSINIIVDNGLPKVDLGSGQDVCSPFAKVLDAKNPNMYYQWYPDNQTSKTILVNKGGTYSVKVTNACGSDSNGIKFREFFYPTIELGPDKASCQTPISLDAGNTNSNYLWSTTEVTQSILASVTGTYSVSVSNICGVATDNISVVIDNGLPIVDLGKDTLLCTPLGLTLNAGHHPMGQITWNPTGETTESIQVVNPGTYSVTVSNSCGNKVDAIIIDQNPVRMKALPDTSICPGNSVQLRTIEDNSYTYKWTPEETLTEPNIYNPIAHPLVSTNYIVRADDGKCYNLDTARVIVHGLVHPQITTNDVAGYIPLTIHFSNPNPGATQTWYLGDGTMSNSPNVSHVYKEEKPFTIILVTTTDKGCVESDTVTIHPFSLFIPNLITPNGDNKNDRFDLTKDFVWLEVEVYNRWGELVFQKDKYIDEWDGTDCADGIYYFVVKDTRFGKQFNGWVQLTRSYPNE